MPERESTVNAVQRYYKATEEGYWHYLDGVCHYGYTPKGYKGRFDMREAQFRMEILLGETLNLPWGSQVLDAGCGYGPVSRTLTKQFGFKMTGIDLIHERLYNANRLNSEDNYKINLARADYHELPFPDNHFDGVFTMETLVHAHSFDTVLSEFRRVLKPGGKLVLFEYTIPELSRVPPLVRDLAEDKIRNTGMTSLPYFIHGSFPRLLEEAGFVDTKAVDISKNVYQSWYYMWKYAVRLAFKELKDGRLIKKGKVDFDRIPGSFWIWPARHKLGYNICEATKPA